MVKIIPLPNGRFIAYKCGLILSTYKSWDDLPSKYSRENRDKTTPKLNDTPLLHPQQKNSKPLCAVRAPPANEIYQLLVIFFNLWWSGIPFKTYTNRSQLPTWNLKTGALR